MPAADLAPTRPRRGGRAAPLPPEERRAALVAATIPLVRVHGLAVTTRQIAEAAAVAEGTIFSVFPDKDSLIAAAVDAALDPGPTIARLGGIDPNRPLGARLTEAVRILTDRFDDIGRLFAAVGPDGSRLVAVARPPTQAADGYRAALAALIAPSADELAVPTDEAARALLAHTLGCAHPALADASPPPERIVEVLLGGLAPAATPVTT